MQRYSSRGVPQRTSSTHRQALGQWLKIPTPNSLSNRQNMLAVFRGLEFQDSGRSEPWNWKWWNSSLSLASWTTFFLLTASIGHHLTGIKAPFLEFFFFTVRQTGIPSFKTYESTTVFLPTNACSSGTVSQTWWRWLPIQWYDNRHCRCRSCSRRMPSLRTIPRFRCHLAFHKQQLRHRETSGKGDGLIYRQQKKSTTGAYRYVSRSYMHLKFQEMAEFITNVFEQKITEYAVCLVHSRAHFGAIFGSNTRKLALQDLVMVGS